MHRLVSVKSSAAARVAHKLEQWADPVMEALVKPEQESLRQTQTPHVETEARRETQARHLWQDREKARADSGKLHLRHIVSGYAQLPTHCYNVCCAERLLQHKKRCVSSGSNIEGQTGPLL